jgi:hypothetical protein
MQQFQLLNKGLAYYVRRNGCAQASSHLALSPNPKKPTGPNGARADGELLAHAGRTRAVRGCQPAELNAQTPEERTFIEFLYISAGTLTKRKEDRHD